MLQLITDLDEINECQVRFDKELSAELKKREFLVIGYKGGNEDHEVYTDGDVWYAFKQIDYEPSHRYWNAFGIGLYGGSNDIVVEINIPLESVNRRVAGLFAKDIQTNDVFLLHRGKISGGRKGIGKHTFLNWYSGKPVDVDDGDGRISEAILVAALEAPDFLVTLKHFIHAVERFKEIAKTSPGILSPDPKLEQVIGSPSYTPEFSGAKQGKQPSRYVAECTHGLVVEALREYLEDVHSSVQVHFGNTRSIDLYMQRSGEIVRVYEVKTHTDTQSIYTAVGQLMMHTAHNQDVGKTTVLPISTSDNEWKIRLQKLGIKLIEYELENGKVTFTG